jgi:3-oxoacid CoA-transferase A subunit
VPGKEAVISQGQSQSRRASRPGRNKVYPSAEEAVADVFDGAVVLIVGFGGCDWPEGLLGGLSASGVSNLTVVCQGVWPGPSSQDRGIVGIDSLVTGSQVAKLVSPDGFYPGHLSATEEKWREGSLEIEVVPQGVLAERIRAGGVGLGGVFLPTYVGTRFAEGKEIRSIDGRDHVFEPALRADFALLRAHAADTLGNLVYRNTQRNWNPVMAMAAGVSVAEVDEILDPGGLDPELVITPGIFVNRIVQTL